MPKPPPKKPKSPRSKKRASQPHDGLIRTALSSLASAKSAIAAALPQKLAARLDLDALRPLPARLVSSALGARESDALFEVPIKGSARTLLVHAIVEHQSEPDDEMALRFLAMKLRLWEEQKRKGEPPSPVLPIVISHGDPWRAPRSVFEWLDIPEDLQELLGPFVPQDTYIVEELSRFSPEEAAARKDLDPALRATYFFLQYCRTVPAFELVIGLTRDDLRAIAPRPEYRDTLTRLLSYTFQTASGDLDAVREALEEALLPHLEHEMGTIAEQLIQRGVEQGLRQGVERGRTEGQRRTLIRLLEAKFGALPKSTLLRVEVATGDEIEDLTLRVLSAKSLEDVFRER